MPKAIVLRMESYLTYLDQLLALGKTNATSEDLAKLFGISSSRVRQDLVALGSVGKPRAGYDIIELRQTIIRTLDVSNLKGMALIGYGNLGRALAGSDIWSHGGFELRAIFDNNSKVIGMDVDGLKVRSNTELFGAIKSEGIEAACIAVTKSAAQGLTDLLVTAGIRGIWNFVPIELSIPPNIVVEHQRLEQGLMTLSYRMKTS